MDAPEFRKRIQAYYTGQLTEEEMASLLRKMDGLSAGDLERMFPEVEWRSIQPYQVTPEELEAGLEKIKHLSVRSAGGRVRKMRRWVQAACISGALVMAGVLAARYGKRSSMGTIMLASAHYKDIKVEDGRRSTITLSDGTVVTVNGGSVLSVPDSFAAGGREVYLREGEAWFDVARDVRRPFIVHTSHMNIQVLGTSFSVRDYGEERSAGISLSTGEVAVRHGEGEPIHLTPGYSLVLNKQTAVFVRKAIDTAEAGAWVRGELVFQGASLHHILNVLKHRYAVSFVLQRSDKEEEKFSATFRNNSLETILQQLQLMSGIRYTIEGKRVLIR
ncbi:MAG: FecR domain-containing protein [Chitinophagaceae bacterium]|nr:FecR domain-containing protein [Chitinophagaceae bacterium]